MAVIKDLGAVTAYASAVEGGYTGTKEEFATLMASYATVAEEAAESAESASQSAESASASAQTATSKASEATTAAQTATAKAEETQADADAAALDASQALSAASTATSKASEAAQSASDAVTAKTAAQTAQTAAEGSATTAQTAAQTATTKAAEAAESARTLTIDTTLTQSGQAADAAETGKLKADLNEISSLGKNIFNKDDFNLINDGIGDTGNVYINTGTSKISRNYSQNFRYCGIYIPIEGGKTYTVSKTAGQFFQIGTSIDMPVHGVSLSVAKAYSYNSAITITAGENDNYLSMIVWKSNADSITEAEMLASLQVEEGSTATAYEEYGRTAFDKIARQANTSLNDLSFLGDITKLETGTNIDNLSNGVAYSDTSTLTNSLVNCPISNTNCKIITFTRYSTFKMQICIGGNRRVYFRTNSSAGFSNWLEIGNYLEKLDVVPSGGVSPKYGEEICPELSVFTGTDATWDGSAWVVAENGSISTSMSVTANNVYLIAFTVTNPYTGADDNGVPAYLNVKLGDDEVTFFGANDAYWYVALKPTSSGTVTFSVTSINHWTGNIAGISIKQVTNYAPYLMSLYSQKVRFITGNNLSVGGFETLAIGDANTAYGKDAQIGLEAARWNTAIGTAAQRCLRNGTGNTAIGASSQANIKSGCYNNALGNATQQAITTGNWNNAIGNEAQLELTEGCNNVNVGRRSGTAMRTGNYNTHIGTWTGFTGVNTQQGVDDDRNTISASFQTLIGGRSRQIDHQSDYLTAVGFETQGDDKAVAIGARAKAKGENSVAIGYGVETTDDDQVAIGSEGQTIIIASKVISFNQDGTVTWQPLF